MMKIDMTDPRIAKLIELLRGNKVSCERKVYALMEASDSGLIDADIAEMLAIRFL